MQCASCQYANAEEARFCAQCGAPLGRACVSCGASVDATHRFCQNCGIKLPWADQILAPAPPEPLDEDREGERREVTVLFGDLTGFTQLSSGLDPEETHALLNRYFATVDSIVRSYGGTIDKHIGDGIMAVFGAPIAHSDDPQRAMRTAIDIHRALGSLEIPLSAHIGIASGVVVASGMGSDEHREYTVIGDTVNLASRLQDQAGPGETAISSAVYRAAGDQFECEARGEVKIKGLSAPTGVWRLVGYSKSDEISESRPIVGRKTELSQFASALDSCLNNRVGQTLLVRGEPGIGKTRLLREFRMLSRERGYRWYSGLVLDFGAGKGSDAIASVICGILRISASADTETRFDAISRAVREQLIDDEQRIYLNDFLALPQSPELRSLYDAMDEATRRSEKERLLAELVRRTSTDASPTVLAIEDIHWAGESTLSLLAVLAQTCANCPALCILTSRIEGDPIDTAWRARAGGVSLTTIDLGPLRTDEALALAEEFSAAERFALTCVERSGGNPLFLEQLLRSAEEAPEGVVPGSVQSIVLTRMDNLAPRDRRALQAASVLGQRFSLDVLRHVTGEADYACGALIEHFLVRPEGSGYLFAHALLRDGVYSSLLKTRRAALHRKAAEWYASRDLPLYAEHLDRAADVSAAEAYLNAAREEARNYHNESALRLSERGVEVAKGAVRHALSCFRGDLLRSLGEVDASIRTFENALDWAQDDIERSRSLIGLAEDMRVADRQNDALKALDEAERAAPADQPLLLAELHHLRGNLYFPAGRVEDCLTQHNLALGFARKAESKEWEARALGGLGDASYLAGRMRTACANFRSCIGLCQELGLGRVEVANRSMVGWTRMYLNEISEACEDGLAAAEKAQRVGQSRAEMLGRMVAGYMHIEQGRLNAGREEVEKALSLARRLGASHFVAEALCFGAMIERAEGRLDAAKRNADEALRILRQVGMTFFGPLALGMAARLSNISSEQAAFLGEAEAILKEGCVSHNHFWFYREAIEGALERKDRQEVDRYCQALERYTSAEPLPWSDLFIARGRALARAVPGSTTDSLRTELKRIAGVMKEAGYADHWLGQVLASS